MRPTIWLIINGEMENTESTSDARWSQNFSESTEAIFHGFFFGFVLYSTISQRRNRDVKRKRKKFTASTAMTPNKCSVFFGLKILLIFLIHGSLLNLFQS